MMENITNCPHCGEPLDEAGVYEHQIFYHVPNPDGTVFEGNGYYDEFVFKCGSCDGELDTECSDGKIYFIVY